MGMDPGTGSYRFFGESDGTSVLDDLFPLRKGYQSKLVPLGNIFGQYNGL